MIDLPPTFEPDTMREWCEALARRTSMQAIPRDDQPYLERYFLAGWNPTVLAGGTPHAASVFLHHFLNSDHRDQVHSHPWGFSCSLILVGGYREERCDHAGRRTARIYRPGEVNVLEAATRHRIDLLEADCWTLFLVGRVTQGWAFSPAC